MNIFGRLIDGAPALCLTLKRNIEEVHDEKIENVLIPSSESSDVYILR